MTVEKRHMPKHAALVPLASRCQRIISGSWLIAHGPSLMGEGSALGLEAGVSALVVHGSTLPLGLDLLARVF